VLRRVQVQPDDVANLLDEERVIGEVKTLASMGLQPEGPPYPVDGGL
jgi:hypothetical protein